MIAVLMCGGSGSRMESETEKPLATVGGVPLVSRVADALYGSQKFERIIAAVSPRTPATKSFLEARGMEVVETPGDGYSRDLSVLLSTLSPARVFVISADMPLVDAQTIARLASSKQSGPLLAVLVTREFAESLGIIPSVTVIHNGGEYCHSGIGIFDTSKHAATYREEYIVMDKIEVAVNVNTKKELELAEKLLVQRV